MAFLFNKKKEDEIESRLISAQLDDTVTALRKIDQRMEKIESRLDMMDKFLVQRIPENLLTEEKFKKEVDTSDTIVNDIIEKVEELSASKSIREILEEKLEEKPTPVEMRRIETITNILHKKGKMNSTQLSKEIGLSRTRCNEYFKYMESMGFVKAFTDGKEKFYTIG